MPGPLPLLPTALVYVLGDLRIEPSEGHHRHTARCFLAIPHEVLALDPTRERAIDGDEPVGHRSCCNGLVLNYSGIRQQRHGRDRPDAEERQPELQVLAYHVDPQAKRAGSGRRCSTGVMIPKGAAKARRHCSGYVAPAQHRPAMTSRKQAEPSGRETTAITAPGRLVAQVRQRQRTWQAL